MLSRLYCRDPSQFNASLEQLMKKADENLYILFTGTKNPSTGHSWCGDCVRAEPILDNAFAKVETKTTLLICDVDREPFRTSGYLYRADPRINLRCVPTLIKWEKGKATLRLDDMQCQNPAAVEELLQSE